MNLQPRARYKLVHPTVRSVGIYNVLGPLTRLGCVNPYRPLRGGVNYTNSRYHKYATPVSVSLNGELVTCCSTNDMGAIVPSNSHKLKSDKR